MNNYDINEFIPIAVMILTVGFSLLGWSKPHLMSRCAFNVGMILRQKQYDRLLTAAFLHIDPMHLFFNMFTLYFFANAIAQFYGAWWFLGLYLGSILVGNVFTLWLYQRRWQYTAMGASGGVAGVLFATVSLSPLMEIYFFFIPVTAWLFATLYFAYSVTMMLRPQNWDNHGHATHLGGAVCGMVFVGVMTPEAYQANGLYIGIMSLPILYLAYEILFNQKAR